MSHFINSPFSPVIANLATGSSAGVSGLSMDTFRLGHKLPVQIGFFKNSKQFIASPKVSGWAV